MSEAEDLDAELGRLQLDRQARESKKALEFKRQQVADLKALARLEDDNPTMVYAAVEAPSFVPGFPTKVYVRMPDTLTHRRFNTQVQSGLDRNSTKAKQEAIDLLGQSCWVYPEDPKDRDAMLTAFPGLLTWLGVAAQKLIAAKVEEEKKE